MPRRDEIKRLLVNYHRRLQALQERKALLGLDTPVAIQTELEDIKAEIEKLQTELEGLEVDRISKSEVANSVELTPINERTKHSVFWWGGGLLLIFATVIIGVIAFSPKTAETTLVEDFKNGAIYWPLGNFEYEGWTERKFIDEVYRWEVTAHKDVAASIRANIPPISDFELEADLNVISDSDIEYGFYFRQGNEGAYDFLLNDRGEYKLKVFHAPGSTSLDKIPWQSSLPPINRGSNNLKVVAQGAEIRLYINGVLVDEDRDETLTTGNIGLIAFLGAEESSIIEMRSFKLIVLDKINQP